jgi:hypothetical protein
LIAGAPAFEPAAELQRAAELLLKYWTLAVPTAVASLLFGVIVIFSVLSVVASVVVGHTTGGQIGTGLGLGAGVLVGLTLVLAGSVALYVAQAMVMAAAPAVLEDRPPDLAASLGVTLRRLPDLSIAMFLTFALALIPLVLSIVLIGLPLLLLLGYFLMYVPAAVVVGNESGVAAIQTSFRITTQRVGESVIGWLGLIAALVAGSIANSILIHIPIINLLAAFAVGGFTSAYSALISVRFYLALRDAAPPASMPPPAYGGPPAVIR